MKSNKRKTALICLCGIAAVSVGGMAVYSAFGSAPETAAATNTASVERMDIRQYVTVSGTVKSSETSELSSSAVNTKVKKVSVRTGDRVKKGDVIAILDDSELQSRLAAAEKQLENIKAKNDIELSSAKRIYDNAVAERAEKSERGSKILSSAKESYDKALSEKNEAAKAYSDAVSSRTAKSDELKAALDEAEAAAERAAELKTELDNAKSEYKRLKAEYDLLEADSTTSSDELKAANDRCDEAAELSAETEAALTEAKEQAKALSDIAEKYASELSSAVLDEKESKAELSTAGRYLEQAKSDVNTASYSKTDTDEANAGDVANKADSLKAAGISAEDMLSEPMQQIEQIKRCIADCTVRADRDGVVTAVNVKEGELYTGGTIAVIQDDSSFMVSAFADQYDISKLEKDQPVEITINAVSSEVLDGTLSFVAPTPDAPTSSAEGSAAGGTEYSLEADLSKQPEGMRIGMTAKLGIITGEKKGVLAVPDNCISTDVDGSSYITVEDDAHAQRKIAVERGICNDYYTEIISSEVSEDMKVIAPKEDNSDTSVFY